MDHTKPRARTKGTHNPCGDRRIRDIVLGHYGLPGLPLLHLRMFVHMTVVSLKRGYAQGLRLEEVCHGLRL